MKKNTLICTLSLLAVAFIPSAMGFIFPSKERGGIALEVLNRTHVTIDVIASAAAPSANVSDFQNQLTSSSVHSVTGDAWAGFGVMMRSPGEDSFFNPASPLKITFPDQIKFAKEVIFTNPNGGDYTTPTQTVWPKTEGFLGLFGRPEFKVRAVYKWLPVAAHYRVTIEEVK